MAMADRPAKRRKFRHSPENSVSPAPVTCCLSSESTQSSDLTKEITKFAELEDENSTCGTDGREINRSERAAESGQMESTARVQPEAKTPAAEKMPSEAELEEFFSAAEKQIHEKFKDKYNFDVTKELPLEGRYEWVKIKP